MGIIVKGLTCPQCNSADVKMTSETNGVCNVCGAQFVVKPDIQTQNVFNEFHIHSDGASNGNTETIYGEIKPIYDKKQFIRECWIELANEDAPFEVFNEDFGDVREINHEVVSDLVEADLTYQASIGYDRQETYIDIETYYEKETYYTSNGTKQERRVQKERPVTKTRTVTDWRPTNGTFSSSTLEVAENLSNAVLDGERFKLDFSATDDSSVAPLQDQNAADLKIYDNTRIGLQAKHRISMEYELKKSLPGDHYRDVQFSVSKINNHSEILYKTIEYAADIKYKGQEYTKNAFPFGGMHVGGDTLENNESLNSYTEKKENSIPDIVWKRTKYAAFAAMALLALSIIISCFIHVLGLVIVAFVFAVASFVASRLLTSKATQDTTKEIEKEIKDYSDNYKAKQRKLLNNKLQSLGLEPVDDKV